MRIMFSLLCVCALAVLFTVPSIAAQEKLTAEQIIEKHRQGLGESETLNSIKTRVIAGRSKVTLHGSAAGTASGDVVMASEDVKSVLGIIFGGIEYPGEKVGYDGKKLTTNYIRQGVRSSLANFLLMHDVVFKEGLFGGTLTTAWPMSQLETRKPKLEYGGLKKVNDRSAHLVRYSPRGGSDFIIKVYFDAETFQHIRTEYNRTVSGQIGRGGPTVGSGTSVPGQAVDQSASVRSTRYEMVEDFGSFKKESGVLLPHEYKLRILIDGSAGTRQFDWEFELTEFQFNQPLPPGTFKVN